MSPIEQKQIGHVKVLIERFFDGITTNEEEKELYLFFSEEDIPAELMLYKSLFTYFETNLEQEYCDINTTPLPPLFRLRRRLSMKSKVRSRLLINGAAAILFIFFSVSAYHIIGNNSRNFDPYEGSFIVKNGVKITDLNQIRPELEATMERVLYKENKAEIEFLRMEYEQQSKYLNFINSFPEGPAREEVMISFQ